MGMKYRVEADWVIERSGQEIEIKINGLYSERTPDVHYLRNGDPGYPGNPSTIDEVGATYGGHVIELTEEEQEKAEEKLLEIGDSGEQYPYDPMEGEPFE